MDASNPQREEALERLVRLHEEVDAEAAELLAALGPEQRCARGCSDCCSDDLRVFEIEAEHLRRSHRRVLRTDAHPSGACAFLDEQGACRVYPARPYVCRTQGLALLWYEEDAEGEIHERRGGCALNVDERRLETLAEDELWLIGPRELELGRLQEAFSGGGQGRVALRSLFGEPGRARPGAASRSAS